MTLRTAAALAALAALATAPAAAQSPKGGKKPEASKAASFDPAALPKLAVLVVGGESARGASQADHHRLVEDVFLEALLAKGHAVVARSDVESLFKEKKFQGSGLTEEQATAVGKFLNVPAVLVVRVTD